jgi:hypothetical protein
VLCTEQLLPFSQLHYFQLLLLPVLCLLLRQQVQAVNLLEQIQPLLLRVQELQEPVPLLLVLQMQLVQVLLKF